jgi:hypothetical protein
VIAIPVPGAIWKVVARSPVTWARNASIAASVSGLAAGSIIAAIIASMAALYGPDSMWPANSIVVSVTGRRSSNA